MSKDLNLEKTARKNDLMTSFIILGFLFLIALVFNRERIYGDAAYYLFQLVNDKRFVIEHNRFIEPVIEFIPYLLVKYSVNLKYVILAASLNEWLYYFVCFLVLAYA